LLEALFMQISGVNLALTWPHRLCLLRVLLWAMPLLQAFPFPSTLGEVTLHPLSQACVFIYNSRGKWVFPPSPVEFSSHLHFYKLSHSWLLGGAAAPAFSSQFVRDFLSPSLWCSGHPALFATCLFCCYCLLFSFFFSFFPGWGSVCPGDCADLAQGFLWEYHMPLSSPGGPRLPKLSGHCCLEAAREPSWFLHLT
jgi:hypothetical protein